MTHRNTVIAAIKEAISIITDEDVEEMYPSEEAFLAEDLDVLSAEDFVAIKEEIEIELGHGISDLSPGIITFEDLVIFIVSEYDIR